MNLFVLHLDYHPISPPDHSMLSLASAIENAERHTRHLPSPPDRPDGTW
jgi:hypothetical protein